ncbi:DUF4747 family protein [Acinetobacter baumannii]|uniref:DUF4747 family protein n=1 Tax=Acinetobacter baumannii TaxID=470 RepID=UPI001058008D|nr:DUF4747 family protein [Acinetobacter baumannii]MDC4283018.1 DUF4747 family protein [Acinetobacter baumannii]MDC4286705.1 DUF4747 family protein [Acinetobacter baumannii]MDC4289491.1 DUF4747 family protein [Acinetobacter baumannii]MDC4321874.1 DUF4747 family protein [Acinetobacter baumannii]MDC4445648.1 DUF4747 family protein [Acinetobacter baumannii]
MGRKTSVDYTAINIRVHPHPAKQIYVDLFKTVFSKNRRIPLGHNVSAKMTRLWELREGKPLEGLVGEIAKYNDINDDSWFNIETGKAADPDELDEINIPEDLRPNCDTFYFIFFPKDHILVSEIRDKDGSFSPKMQEKFFNFLFAPKDIVEQFKAIDVTIFPDTTQIAKILNSKTLKKLELIINRPNPDDFEIFEQEILAEMEEQNAKVYEKKLIAQDKEYLDPNEKTKKQIQVAADNGKVIYSEVDLQTGLTNRDKSTEETPFIYRDRYDPAATTPLDFIKIKATEIAQKLKDRLK